MNKQEFNVDDEQEVHVLGNTSEYSDWVCPLLSITETDTHLLVENDAYTYEFAKSEYTSYIVANCTCSSSKWEANDV